MNREKLEAELERIELRKLALKVKAERAKLRKLEAAERAKRTGRVNIEELRKQITNGLLTGGRGVYSAPLSAASYAWRKLLAMLRQPADSPARMEAEGILRRLHVVYHDGNAETGKGYSRAFYYEPVSIPMTQGDVQVW